MPDALHVLAAAYDDVGDAIADYEAIKDLYYQVQTSDDFDAAVIARDGKGRVSIVRKHEQPTRHGAAQGLRWGLAAGAVAALFPPIGIAGAMTMGAAGGAAIGAVAGHASNGLKREDLRRLGELLDGGDAGLIAVFESDLADQITTNIQAAARIASAMAEIDTERLAADIAAHAATKPLYAR